MNNPLKKEYMRMSAEREPFLETARKASALTIPSVVPPESLSNGSALPAPHDSLGTRGVGNIVSKLVLTMFPSDVPFFRLEPTPQVVSEFQAELGDQANVHGALREAFSQAESDSKILFENYSLRETASTALETLIISGNSVLNWESADTVVFGLDQFVVQRDSGGQLLKMIIEERTSKELIDPEYLGDSEESTDDKPIPVYTGIELRDDDKYHVWQEINEMLVANSEATYTEEDLPYIHLRWRTVKGESYGRGLVEDVLGWLEKLNALANLLSDGALLAARVIFLLDPGSAISLDRLTKAVTGDVIEGNAEDVSTLQVQKEFDFQTPRAHYGDLHRHLSLAFLLNTAIQRDAERVTAEEIRFMSQELEAAYGGAYSLLSQTFQRFLARFLLKDLKVDSSIKEFADLSIVTGYNGLSRNFEYQKMGIFLQALQALPQDPYLNQREVREQLGLLLGIDTKNLLKSEEQVQQEMQQQMLQQAAVESAPGVAREAVKTGEQPNA